MNQVNNMKSTVLFKSILFASNFKVTSKTYLYNASYRIRVYNITTMYSCLMPMTKSLPFKRG